MKSKLFLILGCVFAVSCALEVGESPEKEKEVAFDQMNCVSELDGSFAKYFNAELSDEEIDASFNCLKTAINNFSKFTEGKNPNKYTFDEIINSINEVIFANRNFDMKLAKTFVELKVLIAGGESGVVTKSEIKYLMSFLSRTQLALKRLNRHLPVLTFTSKNTVNLAQIDEAEKVAILEFESLVRLFKGKESAFELSLLNNFFTGNAKKYSSYIQILGAMKKIIVGDNDSLVQKDEWSYFIKETISWYRVWLNYVYLLKDNTLIYGSGYDHFVSTVNRTVNNLDSAARRNKEGISFNKFNEFIDALEVVDKIPVPFRADSLKKSISAVLPKVFSTSHQIRSREFSASVTTAMINRIRIEFGRWVSVQNSIINSFSKKRFGLPFNLGNQLWIQPDQIFSSLKEFTRYHMQMKDLVFQLRSLHLPGEPRIIIASPATRERFGLERSNIYQLSLVNIFRSLAVVVVRGYAENYLRAERELGILDEELNNFTEDIRWIVEDLNIMPPDAKDAGIKMFLEGNMFTFASNGIQEDLSPDSTSHLMTVPEGVELLSYLYSSVKISSESYDQLINICAHGSKDVFDRDMIYNECFWQNGPGIIGSQFFNAPGMKSYLMRMHRLNRFRDDEKDDFIKTVDSLIREPSEDPNWISYIHLGKFVMMGHYVETLIIRFDINNDGVVDEVEGEKHFHHFRGILDKLAKNNCINLSDKDLLLVFKYILQTAQVPGSTWSKISIGWKSIWGWDIKVDRYQALKIFHSILESGNSMSEPKSCEAGKMDAETLEFRKQIESIKKLDSARVIRKSI